MVSQRSNHAHNFGMCVVHRADGNSIADLARLCEALPSIIAVLFRYVVNLAHLFATKLPWVGHRHDSAEVGELFSISVLVKSSEIRVVLSVLLPCVLSAEDVAG